MTHQTNLTQPELVLTSVSVEIMQRHVSLNIIKLLIYIYCSPRQIYTK
jgi:hypothetical protein